MSDAGEPLGLYVHVPFCEVKCSYCHFAIDPGRAPETRQERYVAALLREIEAAPAGHADTSTSAAERPRCYGARCSRECSAR